MPLIDEPKLRAVCAREVQKPGFPVEEFAGLINTLGDAADDVTTACVLAIELYEQTKAALMARFGTPRGLSPNMAVYGALDRYLSET